MATVIDALLITLGLDPTDYKKGEADAAKATVQTGQKLTAEQKKQDANRKRVEDDQRKRAKAAGDEEKKRTDATVKGFKDVALGAAGMLLGFESIKGFVQLLGSMNTSEAGLGRLGKNLGVDVHQMNTWGLAAETLGGKAEDVQASFANVSKSITDLQVNAQVSPLFLLAQRMGMDIRNVTDKTKFLLDLGDKLRAYAAQHGRDNAFNISGLDATTFNLITAENSRKLLQDAETRNNINEKSAADAAAAQAKLTGVVQTVKGGLTDLQHQIVPAAADFAAGAVTSIQNQAEAAAALMHGDFYHAWERVRASAGYGDRVDTDPAVNHANIAAAEKAYGLKPGSLDAIAQIESAFRPEIISGQQVSSKGAKGLMQLMPGTYAHAGEDTRTDIDKAAKEFATLLKHYNGDYVLAAEAYNWGRGNLDHYLRGDKRKDGSAYTLPEETRRYAEKFTAAVRATPGLNRATAKGTIDRSGGGGTTVNVGAVTVNTAATDANGVAAGLASAVKRQTYTAQANTGQVQ